MLLNIITISHEDSIAALHKQNTLFQSYFYQLYKVYFCENLMGSFLKTVGLMFLK